MARDATLTEFATSTETPARREEDHPALADRDTDGMELTNGMDGWRDFPHPEEIVAHVEEDIWTEQTQLPQDVREALDELTDDPTLGEFLVMDAEAAYEYLESIQKKSDMHLETFCRQQLITTVLSNGRRNGKKTKLSTYDKRWIVQWEVRQRMAARDIDEWDEWKLSKENTGLPND